MGETGTRWLFIAASIRSSSASPWATGEMDPAESDHMRPRKPWTMWKSPSAANSRIIDRKRCGFGLRPAFSPASLRISPNMHRASTGQKTIWRQQLILKYSNDG